MALSFVEVGRGGGDRSRDDYIFEGRQFYDGILRSAVALIIFWFHISFTESLYVSSHLLGAWSQFSSAQHCLPHHTQGVNSFGGFFVLFCCI